jgi:hypothetical protein
MNTKTKLELLFDIEAGKTKLKNLTFEEQRIETWNKYLKRMNEVYEDISFLNSKGIKVEKVCCTEYNQSDAIRGFYPYLRLPQYHACMHPIFDHEEFTFGFTASGGLSGMYTVESFIKKICTLIR